MRFIVLLYCVFSSAFALGAENSIVGQWILTEEDGVPTTQQESISFTADGRILVDSENDSCGKYILDDSKSVWVMSIKGRELSIPVGMQVNGEKLEITLNSNVNTYILKSRQPAECSESSAWVERVAGVLKVKAPAPWSYREQVERDGGHIRIQLVSLDYRKLITILASKEVVEKTTSLENIVKSTKRAGELILKQSQGSEAKLLIDERRMVELGDWPLIQFYHESESGTKFGIGSARIGEWLLMAAVVQEYDKIGEIPEILNSIEIDGVKISD